MAFRSKLLMWTQQRWRICFTKKREYRFMALSGVKQNVNLTLKDYAFDIESSVKTAFLKHRLLKKIQHCLVATIIIFSATIPSSAHPLDELNLYHFYSVHFQSKTVRIKYQILVGGLVVFKVWNQMDRDKNRSISPVEKSAFVSSIVSSTNATLDAKTIALLLISSTLPTYEDLITGNSPTLDFEFDAALPSNLIGRHTLNISSNGFPGYTSVVTNPIASSDPGSPIVDSMSTNKLSALFQFHVGDSNTSTNPIQSNDPNIEISMKGESATKKLKSLIPTKTINGFSLIAVLFVAFILGAGHALTPGHGKALVGTYLVAEHGTLKDAVKLGLITTGAHVGSVYLFGFAVLGAMHYMSERALGTWMGVLSGLLVLITGGYLLLRGLLRWYGINVDHNHDHSQTVTVDHPHSHDHTHSHPHVASLWSIGFAGGLAPCPDAIAVLAASIQIGNIAMGIALITAFSAGLGMVLVLIGIIMVKAGSKLNRWSDNSKAMKILPIFSATAVILLGLSLLNQTLTQAGILNWHAITK